jgi:hypothetical protein
MEKLDDKTMLELLILKEEYRVKHGLYIENEMGERGSMNHKTKQYFTCEFKKRVKHPKEKYMRWNASISYQTFDTYREALVFCLERAAGVVDYIKKTYGE